MECQNMPICMRKRVARWGCCKMGVCTLSPSWNPLSAFRMDFVLPSTGRRPDRSSIVTPVKSQRYWRLSPATAIFYAAVDNFMGRWKPREPETAARMCSCIPQVCAATLHRKNAESNGARSHHRYRCGNNRLSMPTLHWTIPGTWNKESFVR